MAFKVGLPRSYEIILEQWVMLYIPDGYWHHLKYMESKLSLRAQQSSLGCKLDGICKLFGMPKTGAFMKKTPPEFWLNKKENFNEIC